jgi:hypothetical protein
MGGSGSRTSTRARTGVQLMANALGGGCREPTAVGRYTRERSSDEAVYLRTDPTRVWAKGGRTFPKGG